MKMLELQFKSVLFSVVFLATICKGTFSEIYDFKVKTIKGELVDMSMYRGTVRTYQMF